MKTRYPTPPTFTVICVGNASSNFPSKKAIMSPNTTITPLAKLKILFALLALAGPVLLAEPPTPPTPRYHLVPEPAYMRPPVQLPIAGTTRTLFTPTLIDGDTVTYVLPAEYNANPTGIDDLARQNASEDLATLAPRFIRDDNDIIQFAVVDSDQPFVASTVLAPDFIERFETTLGPDLLVAIPNRYRIYVFPALASRFADIADAVLSDYTLTPYPVSKEVFRIRPDHTLEAIGTYDERR